MSKPEEISRRSLLQGLVVGCAAATALAVAATQPAQADPGMSQQAAKYQPTPKDGKKCADCIRFVAPNACKMVKGDISPNGWCLMYAKKPDA